MVGEEGRKPRGTIDGLRSFTERSCGARGRHAVGRRGTVAARRARRLPRRCVSARPCDVRALVADSARGSSSESPDSTFDRLIVGSLRLEPKANSSFLRSRPPGFRRLANARRDVEGSSGSPTGTLGDHDFLSISIGC